MLAVGLAVSRLDCRLVYMPPLVPKQHIDTLACLEDRNWPNIGACLNFAAYSSPMNIVELLPM